VGQVDGTWDKSTVTAPDTRGTRLQNGGNTARNHDSPRGFVVSDAALALGKLALGKLTDIVARWSRRKVET
jgi:hypothetical protein